MFLVDSGCFRQDTILHISKLMSPSISVSNDVGRILTLNQDFIDQIMME